MKRVLVTGGSGFIGSHVIDKLAAAGYEPRNYDLRHSPHHAPGSIDTVIGDLCDTDALRAAMQDCEFVVHLAASADVGIVAENPEEAERANSRGTIAVLEAARQEGIKRVVYGSTIWVYGDSEADLVDEDAPLGLTDHLYTATKLAGEMYCSSYAELYGLDYTILRFGIPYGPRARPATVIPIFVRKALAGEPLQLAGDGMQTRRFVYVEDLADGVVSGLAPEAANRVYNLASSETITIKALAELVGEEAEPVEIVHGPGRSGDFGGAEISSKRAAEELGWSASTPLREGVRRYLTWLNDESATAAERAAEEIEAVTPRPSLRERVLSGASVPALACAVGTLVPYTIALRVEGLTQAQQHSIAFTTPMAILVLLCLGVPGAVRSVRSVVAASMLAVLYTALIAMPWSRATLDLARPHEAASVLIVLGVVAAMGVALSGQRLRTAPSPAANRVS
ncbi:MAG: UDP-glucose 4-epimerase [Solirubrobacterales bacterium]|nr:UDP-glucose 4-epimerase [Solirubrobacterales bacterium]